MELKALGQTSVSTTYQWYDLSMSRPFTATVSASEEGKFFMRIKLNSRYESTFKTVLCYTNTMCYFMCYYRSEREET